MAKKSKHKNRSNIVTNSIKALKMVGSKGRVICIIMTENQQNIVKQLFSNLKMKLKREIKMIYMSDVGCSLLGAGAWG